MIEPPHNSQEIQKRVTSTIQNLAAACDRLRDSATLAKLDMIELATAMDKERMASVEQAAASAIQSAQKPPQQRCG